MNANIGMLSPVAATISSYTTDGAPNYGAGKIIAEAVSASLTWERADGRFYGDDVQLDSENGVLGYSLEFEPSGLADDAREYILGETVQTDEYSITEDASPDVGFGYVRVMRTTNTSGNVVTSYEGWWFYKLKFGVTREETRTKERSITWRTPTLTGIGSGVKKDSTGKLHFATHKTFTSASDAISYVKAKANIT